MRCICGGFFSAEGVPGFEIYRESWYNSTTDRTTSRKESAVVKSVRLVRNETECYFRPGEAAQPAPPPAACGIQEKEFYG